MLKKGGFSIKKMIKRIILLFIVYTLIGSVFIYYIRPAEPKKTDVKNLYSSDIDGNERVRIVDDRDEAYIYRMKMIKSAQKSIDIAYYSIKDGYTARNIFGALVDAAERGVDIRIMVDGMFQGFKDEFKNALYLSNLYPNIKISFYEPVNILKPWVYNNRLHDKFIIVDKERYILGGRNIEDRFLKKDYIMKKQVRDRDVYVVNRYGHGSARDLSRYFDSLWESRYSYPQNRKLNEGKKGEVVKFRDMLISDLKNAYKDSHLRDFDINRDLIDVNRISVVSNPLESGNKSPVILNLLGQLSENAEDIKCQSPYIDPTFMIGHFLKPYKIKEDRITAYTNFIDSSPNPCALAGYTVSRNSMLKNGMKIYEYKGPDSIHGKSFIFDDELSVVGSFNMDNRSSFMSTETVLVIHGREFAKELNRSFEKIGSESTVAKRNPEKTPRYIFYYILGIFLFPFRILL